MRAAVITVSDRSARGEREDVSGPLLRKYMEEKDADVAAYRVVPDERPAITATLIELSDQGGRVLGDAGSSAPGGGGTHTWRDGRGRDL